MFTAAHMGLNAHRDVLNINERRVWTCWQIFTFGLWCQRGENIFYTTGNELRIHVWLQWWWWWWRHTRPVICRLLPPESSSRPCNRCVTPQFHLNSFAWSAAHFAHILQQQGLSPVPSLPSKHSSESLNVTSALSQTLMMLMEEEALWSCGEAQWARTQTHESQTQRDRGAHTWAWLIKLRTAAATHMHQHVL